MLDEILASAKDSLLERLSSPLLGSFVLSWCAWNYKFLVILFSDASVTQTFKLIENIAFPTLSSVILNGILLPLGSALAYIFLYPYPAKFIYGFTQRRQKEINDIKKKIADETPLTIEESRLIREEFRERDRKSQEQIDKLTQELSRLQSSKARSNKSEKVLANTANALYPKEITESQLSILKRIEEAGGRMAESQIISGAVDKKVKVEFDLGELVEMKLLDRDFSNREHEYFYVFTHLGRKTVLNDGKFSN